MRSRYLAFAAVALLALPFSSPTVPTEAAVRPSMRFKCCTSACVLDALYRLSFAAQRMTWVCIQSMLYKFGEFATAYSTAELMAGHPLSGGDYLLHFAAVPPNCDLSGFKKIIFWLGLPLGLPGV